MDHNAPGGAAKLLRACTLPLTGERVVHRVITDHCVLDITSQGFTLAELASNVSIEQVRASPGADVHGGAEPAAGECF